MAAKDLKRMCRRWVATLRRRRWPAFCWALVVAASWPQVANATNLTGFPTQDLNGHGGSDVDNQATTHVDVKAYGESHPYNRKALFLFDLASFGGRNLMDQYVHSASFIVWASDSQCDGFLFRLYGFTETSNNDDSRWDESLTSQSEATWPDRYFGAYQYPGGNGVKTLDTQAGPVKDASVSFGGVLAEYVRWGVDRNAPFGYSATNPDSRITLLLAREDVDNDISGFHSRQTTDGDTVKPRLTLDVRFPEIRVAIGASNNISSGGTYDFGVAPETNQAPISRDLVIDNQLGEALSSLHVSSLSITGVDARAFFVTTTNVYLSQGQSNRCGIVFNPGGTNAWGIWDKAWLVVQSNDEDERPFSVRLRGEIFPQLRFTEARTVVNAHVALFWASRTGRWYTVWESAGLVAGGWTSSASVRANDRLHGWTNDIGSSTQSFYRVELLP
jgi:hypothetical protein